MHAYFRQICVKYTPEDCTHKHVAVKLTIILSSSIYLQMCLGVSDETHLIQSVHTSLALSEQSLAFGGLIAAFCLRLVYVKPVICVAVSQTAALALAQLV
jgi:hypothetical protein